MYSCVSNRSIEDESVLGKICFDVLTTKLDINSKQNNNDIVGIFVDGRNRSINAYQDFAALKSFKLFSNYNYPLYVFCHNTNNFLNNDKDLIKDYRITVIKIPSLNSLIEYSDFCIKKLFFYEELKNVKYALMLSSDGFLLREGWELFCLNKDYPFLGAHFQHSPGIIYQEKNQWYKFGADGTRFSNGGFGWRDIEVMKQISNQFGNLTLAEMGNPDFTLPKEDLFFGFFIYSVLNYKNPTLQECCEFSKDPLSLERYLSNNKPLGFHYPVLYNKYCCLEH